MEQQVIHQEASMKQSFFSLHSELQHLLMSGNPIAILVLSSTNQCFLCLFFTLSYSLVPIWAGGVGRHGNTTLQSPWGLWDRSQSCVDTASGCSVGLTLFPSLPPSALSFLLFLIFLAISVSLTHTHAHYTLLLTKALFR